MLALIVILAFFAAPIVALVIIGPVAQFIQQLEESGNTHWLGLLMIPCYMLTMFITTFMNVAFYNEILYAFNGKPISIRRGLRLA